MKIRETSRLVYERKYEAEDGTLFNTEQECIDYENRITEKRKAAQAIESIECNIPFTNWDSDVDESKIYIIRSEEEFKNLAEWQASEWGGIDALYWDEPQNYPVALLVISRPDFSYGSILRLDDLDNMLDAVSVIASAYLTTSEEGEQ